MKEWDVSLPPPSLTVGSSYSHHDPNWQSCASWLQETWRSFLFRYVVFDISKCGTHFIFKWARMWQGVADIVELINIVMLHASYWSVWTDSLCFVLIDCRCDCGACVSSCYLKMAAFPANQEEEKRVAATSKSQTSSRLWTELPITVENNYI